MQKHHFFLFFLSEPLCFILVNMRTVFLVLCELKFGPALTLSYLEFAILLGELNYILLLRA